MRHNNYQPIHPSRIPTMKMFPLLSALALTLLIAACGQGTAPPSTTAPVADAAAPAPDAAAPLPGERTYKTTCSLCHAAGVAGAPKLGDKADWAPRLAQGKELLYQHALQGFTGQKGVMPPRGTGMSLKDEEITAAVDYMAAKAE